MIGRLLILIPVMAVSAIGCAYKPINQRLEVLDSDGGYRFKNLESPENSDELFVILTFSGGGTRAASLAYGVLQQLRDTTVEVEGETRSLLDEVDVISSISGGSFTAAYYALHGDGIFDSFEDRFLKRDIQGELLAAAWNPWKWMQRASKVYSISDAAAEIYDKQVFEGLTYAEIIDRGRRPYVIISAMDMTSSRPFRFTQEQFDLLYSDLASVPVSRAVASSSAFPIVLSPMTFRNYRKPQNYRQPAWITSALSEEVEEHAPLRFKIAKQAQTYLDTERRPYVHLLDGGIVDNLGTFPVMWALVSPDGDFSLIRLAEGGRIKRVVVILVNAWTEKDSTWDQHPDTPSVLEVAGATIHGLQGVQYDLTQLVGTMTREGLLPSMQSGSALADVEFIGIHVRFDDIEDPEERHYFKTLPTSFVLEVEQVDRLIEVASTLLLNSEHFQHLLASLNGQVTPRVVPGT